MNFFLREDKARELCDRMAHLKLRWWCEARVDIMSRYSDETWTAIKNAGCTMIFFGAESRLRLGSGGNAKGHLYRADPGDLPAALTSSASSLSSHSSSEIQMTLTATRGKTLRFIRKIKRINPDSEIIIQHYTPTPQPHKAGGEMYGNIEVPFPDTPAGWATEEWMNFTLRVDTHAPWLKTKTKKLIDNFEIVVGSRWPTVQDIRAPRWSRRLLQVLSAWRYAFHVYSFPFELQLANQFIALRKPKRESLWTACAQLDGQSLFDRWAAVYDRDVNPLLQLEERWLAALLPETRGSHILDIGCGTGRWLRQLEAMSPTALTGADPSPAMLARAREKTFRAHHAHPGRTHARFRSRITRSNSFSPRLSLAISRTCPGSRLSAFAFSPTAVSFCSPTCTPKPKPRADGLAASTRWRIHPHRSLHPHSGGNSSGLLRPGVHTQGGRRAGLWLA